MSDGCNFREPLSASWSDLDHLGSFGRDCNHKRVGCVIRELLGLIGVVGKPSRAEDVVTRLQVREKASGSWTSSMEETLAYGSLRWR